jgi:hypothetical protein
MYFGVHIPSPAPENKSYFIRENSDTDFIFSSREIPQSMKIQMQERTK